MPSAAEIEVEIAAWTGDRIDYDVMQAARALGLAAGVVQNTEDMYRRDSQLAARNFFEEIPHYKRGSVVATGIPFGLTGTPGRTTHSGSSIGHDNETVLQELLGLTQEEIDQLIAKGAVEPAC